MVVNQSRILLDTNIALYYLGGRLTTPLPKGQYYISIITEMELLSYPNLSSTEEQQIQNFLSQLLIVDINNSIKKMAISLRKQYRLKLPDAIIAATAQSLQAILLTNDNRLCNIGSLLTQSMSII
jgi:predicted nucleic acid-binding protein